MIEARLIQLTLIGKATQRAKRLTAEAKGKCLFNFCWDVAEYVTYCHSCGVLSMKSSDVVDVILNHVLFL